jgi:type IV pilus assembly protein PilP
MWITPIPLNRRTSFGGILLLLTLHLTSCGGGDMNDLVAEVDKIKAKKNNEVAPLPEFKHIPSYFYEVDKMRDPFIPFMDAQQTDITVGLKTPTGKETKGPCPGPDPHRVRVGLELMPLDSLRMVGTLEEEKEKDKTLWALVMASDGTIYRVKQGEFIGQNSGKIINIEENKIELQELLPNKEGCWTETATTLELSS